MKKAMIFGLAGGGCRAMAIQEVIVDQNSARVCMRLARRSPLFSSFYIFCLNALNALNALSVFVCDADAIIKLTHNKTQAHSNPARAGRIGPARATSSACCELVSNTEIPSETTNKFLLVHSGR